MPRKLQPKTPEQRIRAIERNVQKLLQISTVKAECVQLSTAQTKDIWQCLHTVSLYLEQPEKIRKTQIQKIFASRTALEMEYREQTGREIDK